MKPRPTDKTLKDEITKLNENGKVKSDKRELVKIFNKYFSNIVSNLDIQRLQILPFTMTGVKCNKKKFENHPSILEIKKINSV